MHKQGICHRDLKCENILIGNGKEFQIKMGDFGSATSFKGEFEEFKQIRGSNIDSHSMVIKKNMY